MAVKGQVVLFIVGESSFMKVAKTEPTQSPGMNLIRFKS